MSSFKKQSASPSKQEPEQETSANTATTISETAEKYSEMSPEDILNRELAKGLDLTSSTTTKEEDSEEVITKEDSQPEPSNSHQEPPQETETMEDTKEEKCDNSESDSTNKDNTVVESDQIDNGADGPIVAEDIGPGASDDEFYDADS